MNSISVNSIENLKGSDTETVSLSSRSGGFFAIKGIVGKSYDYLFGVSGFVVDSLIGLFSASMRIEGRAGAANWTCRG